MDENPDLVLSSPKPQRRAQQMTNRRRRQASGPHDGLTAEVLAAVQQTNRATDDGGALVASGQAAGQLAHGALAPGLLTPETDDRSVNQERVIMMMTARPDACLEAFQKNMEAGESSSQADEGILKQLEYALAQLKRYEALAHAAAAITGSPVDTPAETLAESLMDAWVVQRFNQDQMESSIEHIKREKQQAQDELKDLVHFLKKVIGSSDDLGSGDLSHDILESWTEMKEKNARLERQIKDQMKNIVSLEVEAKSVLERIKIFAIDVGVAEDLAEIRTDKLVSKIHTKTAELRREIEYFREEKALFREDSSKIQALTEELAALRRAQAVPTPKKRSKKWRFFRKKNKVCIEQQEAQSNHMDEKESPFRRHIERMNSRINSLERDKAILESQIGKLMECDEAAKRFTQKLMEQNRTLEEDNQSKEEKVGLLEYETDRKTDKIKRLYDLMERMSYNGMYPNSATNDVQSQSDHAVVASLTTLCCKKLDLSTLRELEQPSNPDDSSVLELDVIGNGAFGLVLLGHLDGLSKPVAIKMPYVPAHLEGEKAENEWRANHGRTRKESLVSELLKGCPYFAQMVGTITIGRDLCIVTEFVGDGQTERSYRLHDALQVIDPTPCPPRWNMVAIAEDLVRGVSIIHDFGLLHNDIKGDNILLEHRGERWHGVIIDMGLVTTMAYTEQRSFSDLVPESQRLDFPHIAPELVNSGAHVSASTDIFAVGVQLKNIGQFIDNDELVTVGEHCCKNEPHLRPKALDDIMPKVVEIKTRMQNERRLNRSGTFVIESDQNGSSQLKVATVEGKGWRRGFEKRAEMSENKEMQES